MLPCISHDDKLFVRKLTLYKIFVNKLSIISKTVPFCSFILLNVMFFRRSWCLEIKLAVNLRMYFQYFFQKLNYCCYAIWLDRSFNILVFFLRSPIGVAPTVETASPKKLLFYHQSDIFAWKIENVFSELTKIKLFGYHWVPMPYFQPGQNQVSSGQLPLQELNILKWH